MEKEKGCVYFFRHLGLSPVKIGYSNGVSPKNRFDNFRTYAPFGAEMLGFINSDNANGLEFELHSKYKSRRLNGEWFDISEEEVQNEIKNYTEVLDKKERSLFWEEYANKKYADKKQILLESEIDEFKKSVNFKVDENMLNDINNFLKPYILSKDIIYKVKLKKDFLIKHSSYIGITSQRFNIYSRIVLQLSKVNFIETRDYSGHLFRLIKEQTKP